MDGFRLDVAEIVPLDFWREYRRVVREINPEAYLVGEVWWEKWPDTMFDTAPWLQGDVFDAVMNYPFAEAAVAWIGHVEHKLSASEFDHKLAELRLAFGRSLEVATQRGLFLGSELSVEEHLKLLVFCLRAFHLYSSEPFSPER